MEYITGTYALNLRCPDGTWGDWHFCCLDWEHPTRRESGDSPFGEWGIYVSRDVPGAGEEHVASHARACLDLVEMGKFGSARGMRRDFLGDDFPADEELFELVARLRGREDWPDVDAFMASEYLGTWLDFKEGRGL